MWSGRRGSNPRPTAWKAVTLPLSYSRDSRVPKYRPPSRRAFAATRRRVSLRRHARPAEPKPAARAKAGGEGRTRTFEAARATDLQSAAFDRFATSPAVCVVETRASGRSYVCRWSWRRDLNPRPADYKSAALPTELRQPEQNANFSTSRASMARECAGSRKLTSCGRASAFPATFYCTHKPVAPAIRIPYGPASGL